MKKGMRFFFYGTLIDCRANPAARHMHTHLRPLGRTVAAGRLYAIPDRGGWYPALLPGRGKVHGRLYEAMDSFSSGDLARMDAYEDYDSKRPAASLYLRKSVATDAMRAEAYVYNRPVPLRARRIASGDFTAWLAETGSTAFGSARF
ncbi:MAG: gamma-glutamylcyclotransferase [Novosphingobium sp.]|nr:gamma-glutamylcyclotransferase [Novosphingobium sp.]